MRSDKLFAVEREAADFTFDESTAEVFDDMIARSVPGYEETTRMLTEMALHFAGPAGLIYDLGCSTGATLASLANAVKDPDVKLVGIDNSEPMLARARARLDDLGITEGVDLQRADLTANTAFRRADVFILNLTLQFIRPPHRPTLLLQIHEALRPGGGLLLVEKVLADAPPNNRLFVRNYHAFKSRNGYSDLEIAQKREALENVLVPFRVDENVEQLRRAGFVEIDCFFRWYNFAGFVARRA